MEYQLHLTFPGMRTQHAFYNWIHGDTNIRRSCCALNIIAWDCLSGFLYFTKRSLLLTSRSQNMLPKLLCLYIIWLPSSWSCDISNQYTTVQSPQQCCQLSGFVTKFSFLPDPPSDVISEKLLETNLAPLSGVLGTTLAPSSGVLGTNFSSFFLCFGDKFSSFFWCFGDYYLFFILFTFIIFYIIYFIFIFYYILLLFLLYSFLFESKSL